jgi:cell wall assembly regulator SMI1
MNLNEIFNQIADHLNKHGIPTTFEIGAKCSEAELIKIESEMGLKIPADLRKIYLECGNGASFRWQECEDDDKCEKFVLLEIPNLESLNDQIKNWREKRFWSWTAEDYSIVTDPSLAKLTVQRMKTWLPILEEGNGDKFCVETANGGCAIVFHQHDWNDGGTGNNGPKIADSFTDFLQQWSKACFQLPSSLWWPSVITNCGIDWASEKFDKRYFLDFKK